MPMAGTMPTIPDTVGLAGLGLEEELPIPNAGSGTAEIMEVVGNASCGIMSDAAIVATGLPLGSTNVMSPVGVAAFLWPPPPR